MMKMKKKNLKPIDVDAHFKYRCPLGSCGYDHWLSLKQVSTKNYKVVCDCGTVFKPKLINKLKIQFYKELIEETQKDSATATLKIPVDLQSKSSKILERYGFTQSECLLLTEKAFSKIQTDDVGLFVKYIIQNLGELNELN